MTPQQMAEWLETFATNRPQASAASNRTIREIARYVRELSLLVAAGRERDFAVSPVGLPDQHIHRPDAGDPDV